MCLRRLEELTHLDDPQRHQTDSWASGSAYQPYAGRWSHAVAQTFVPWLAVPPGSLWLDVGCGTGALTQAILKQMAPAQVKGIDQSEGFVAFAQNRIQDERAQFEVGDAQVLAVEADVYDAVVSGLVLNFIPHPEQAITEMARVTKPGGKVAVYVWDYAGKMQYMRHFWNAAAALDPKAYDLDEGRRFPICNPEALTRLFQAAGLKDVDVCAIDIDTDFKDFVDYWSPFLGGQGPAPTYVMSLSEEDRAALRENIRHALPFALDGSIPLVARAWAVCGTLDTAMANY
jgi:ubiquinone/menaquinone biosynthesis C-methylase UbiE